MNAFQAERVEREIRETAQGGLRTAVGMALSSCGEASLVRYEEEGGRSYVASRNEIPEQVAMRLMALASAAGVVTNDTKNLGLKATDTFGKEGRWVLLLSRSQRLSELLVLSSEPMAVRQ